MVDAPATDEQARQ